MEDIIRRTYQQIPGGILLVTDQGKVSFANYYLESLLGYPANGLEDKPLSEVLPECDALSARDIFDYFTSENGRLYSAIKQDNSVCKVAIRLSHSESEPHEIIFSVNDASAHQAAIESLNLSQGINKTATWSYDLTSNVVWWSPELFRIFNLPVANEAPPFETHHLLFSPESWEKLQPAVAAASEQGIPYELELQLGNNNTTEDNQPRYAVARCEPQLDDTGKVVRLVGTFQDVSGLKHTQLELEETLLRLNESITAGGIGLWDWDPVTGKVSFSSEYKRQLGYADHEFQDSFEEWQSRLHPDDIEETLANVQRSIETGNQDHGAIFRLRHRDGSYRWILSHARVFNDRNGEPVRMLGSHIDITEQRKLENQLRHSQKMESVGQLAGGVAHDFNNQLATIMGFAELIAASDDMAKIKYYVQRIFNAAEASGNLTKKLLTFSRQDNLTLERVDMHELINETVELLSHSIDKRIQLYSEQAADNAYVPGDKSLLQNALLNLGVNAKDAMPDGGMIRIITKNITLTPPDSLINEQSESELNYLQIEFADTGCGIPEQQLSKIFDPFFTTKEAGSGTGLGLASVYGTIQQMHGSIEVESQEGMGTRFIIWLPLHKEKKDKTPCSDNVGATHSSKPKTILVVDDEPQLRQISKDFLEVLGHQCLLAENGNDAVSVYRQHQQDINLVIMDMIMPGMNGKDAFEELKKLNPDVKVIVSSGFTADTSAEDLLHCGVRKIIQKPFKLTELESCVNEVAD